MGKQMLNYVEMVDKELIVLLKQNDDRAFAEIYNRYGIIVFYTVNKILKDEDGAKDLVQDIFAALWTRSANIWDDADLAAYLYVAARNRVLKLIKMDRTKEKYFEEIGKFSTVMSFDTVQKLDEKELIILLRKEIAKFPPKMREIFELSRLEELSHREISLKLGISEGTVRKQIQYALRILRLKFPLNLLLSIVNYMALQFLRK